MLSALFREFGTVRNHEPLVGMLSFGPEGGEFSDSGTPSVAPKFCLIGNERPIKSNDYAVNSVVTRFKLESLPNLLRHALVRINFPGLKENAPVSEVELTKFLKKVTLFLLREECRCVRFQFGKVSEFQTGPLIKITGYFLRIMIDSRIRPSKIFWRAMCWDEPRIERALTIFSTVKPISVAILARSKSVGTIIPW